KTLANSHGAFNFDDADDVDKVPETELDDPLEQNENPSEDPFGIYSILNKNKEILLLLNTSIELNRIDADIDKGLASDIIINRRMEGDENLDIFSGVLNTKKKSNLNIRGFMVVATISIDQQPELEGAVSKEEVKKAACVLAAKEKGGLGVSSLFALNRALLMKWFWRFYSHNDSLWSRVIKAIYGVDGEVNKVSKYASSKPLKLLFPRIYALDNIKDASICMKLNEPSLDNNFRRSIRGGIEQSQFKKLTDLLIPIVLLIQLS
ncbi:hypothetical protein Tco_1313546, partial [Tanacetum coccineum]